MAVIGSQSKGGTIRLANDLGGGATQRRRLSSSLSLSLRRAQSSRAEGNRAVVEAVESRLLMSTNYTLAPLAAFSSSTGFAGNGLVMDGQGNMYGTTQDGGAGNLGTIFEIPAGTSSINVLAAFDGSSNGGVPVGKLVRDADGNLFGVTSTGGSTNGGTIFELAAGSSTITVLATLDGTSGVEPSGGLAMDGQGNLFGFTSSGGTGNLGTIFELPAGSNTIDPLVAFSGSVYEPAGAPLIDSQGNLFGNSQRGGSGSLGTVFELPSGGSAITTLVTFDSSTTGYSPDAGLVADAQGNLYGATQQGGANFTGAIFKVDGTSHVISTLASFSQSAGESSGGTLLIDGNGNLYGTTQQGGANTIGTIFELPAGQSSLQVLGSFDNSTGYTFSDPMMMRPNDCSLIMDSQGNLLGTTQEGGAGSLGAVFELAPIVATHVVITQQPANVAAGATDTLTVKLEDTFGNVDTSVNSDVTVAIATGPDGGTLAGTATVAAVNGVATFSGLSYPTAGDYTLTISEGSLTPATSNSFTVSPGAAAKLVITRQPTLGSDGHSLSTVLVAVEDAQGNLVNTDSSTVSVSPSSGTLNGTTTAAAVDGVASFSDLSLSAGGTYTLNFTDAALTAATSQSLTVAPDVQAGAVLQPLAVDLGGSGQPHQKLTVTLLSGPDGAKLWGKTHVWTTDGQASFSHLKFKQAGQYTLQVTDSSGTVVQTKTLNVAAAEARRLAFVQPPAILNGVASASVEILDRFGNVVSDDTSDVTLRVGRHNLPLSQRLDGAVTMTPVDGVASFSDFAIDRPAGTYRLVAMAAGHEAVYSHWFKVS